MDDLIVNFDDNLFVYILNALAEPRKYEIAFINGYEAIDEGLLLTNLSPANKLGLKKAEKSLKQRRTTAIEEWLKYKARQGWFFDGQVEIEGLTDNGFIQMKRELPNEKLLALLNLRAKKTNVNKIVIPKEDMIIEKISEIAGEDYNYSGVEFDDMVMNEVEEIPEELIQQAISSKQTLKQTLEKGLSNIVDETLMEQFERETGKNAMYRGKITKGYLEWKKNVLEET